MHRSVWFKHSSQRTEARIRIGEVMENPGAHDLIETQSQIVDPLDAKLMNLEIFQVVFSLELFRMAHARGTMVDAGNLSRRPTQRMLRSLGCSATCNEDGLVFSIRAGWPK